MLAPQLIATRSRPLARVRRTSSRPRRRVRAAARAIARVSSKTSLIAAQISSVSTTIISSTCSSRQPERLRADALARRRRPRTGRRERASRARRPQRAVHGVRVGRLARRRFWISGQSLFTYAAMPAMRPPPPTATKIASIGSRICRRISIPIVPWPAITSGSSYGCTNVSLGASPIRTAVSWASS